MTEKFFTIAEQLDNLKIIERPTEEDMEKLSMYLSGIEYVRYFFQDLESPGWVELMHKQSWFSQPPDPLEDENQPGFFSMPIWHEGEYLYRMADKFPQVVKDVALNLDTENSRAVRTMLITLLKVPPKIVGETVIAFERWLETPFVSFMSLSHEIGKILEYLAGGNQVSAALTVLDILSEPVGINDPLEEGKIVAGTRHDYYFLQEAFNINVPKLIEIHPIGVVDVIENQLIKSINLEHDPNIKDKDRSLNSFWRLNINPEGDFNYRRDFKNLLVNTIIFALDKACEHKIDEAPNVLEHYINSEYSIQRRIGVFILRRWGGQYTDLLEKAYIRHVEEPIVAGQSEFQWLVDAQYGNLPEYLQKEILDAIKAGPLDHKWVEELLNKYPDQFEGNTKQEKRQSLVDEWQLREYDHIASFLKGEEKEIYERLLEKYDKPEPRPEAGVITSWVGPESPIGSDELSKMTIEEAIQFLVDYVPPEEDSIRVPSREGLGRIFEENIKARANDYAENALLLIRGDLHYVFHTHYLRGLESAIKNHEKLALLDVITLCEFLADQEEDDFPKQEFEPGLPSAKLAVANILEQLLKNKEPYIDDELLDRIGQIIVDLLNQEESDIGIEDDSGFDPATRSLNCSRGMAMHCLVKYGLYCERKRKKEQGDEGELVMSPFVKAALTEKLDKSKDPSLAIHSVFGWYFPQLIYLDREWALENHDRIFPLEPDKANYWQAAWSAYIRFSDVYSNVFPLLMNSYQRALENLPRSDKEVGFDRVDEKLATHVLKAYLLDMIEIDSEDQILSLYFKNSSDETRSHGNFWLSKVLEAQQPSHDDETWTKIWNLWRWRLEEANSTRDKKDFMKEVTSFCRLLKHVPLGLEEMYPVLIQTIEYKAIRFELVLIIEYLGKNSKDSPEKAISMLNEIVLSSRDFYMTSDTRGQVKTILESAISADNETKEKAVGIINIFGEHGDYEWRPMLEKLN